MIDHPRLYAGAEHIGRLTVRPTWHVLQDAAQRVDADAGRYAGMPPLTYAREGHNALLIRAREVQTRVVTLLVRWLQTHEARFRDAAVAHIRDMGGWDYWSWIARRAGDAAYDAIFDLSYGENSATLAIAYDWLYDSLTPEEQTLFLDIARERAFASGLKHAQLDGAWWFGKPDSNWNTVCAGGLGMLALAMFEDLPEAADLLPRVEASVAPYMQHLAATGGAWPEGIGYWNYGMRYAFIYLLSHERATGRLHPLMELPSTAQTLRFPLDFCPHGQPCSFGDVNRWSPLPFHYAAALRVGAVDVQGALDAYLAAYGISGGSWPNAAEWLLLHPGDPVDENADYLPDGVKLYEGLDWGYVADAGEAPYLYLAIRGGTTEVPHGHRDLLSYHCVVGREKLVSNIGPVEYLDTTFSGRREEIFEITPASKNTILINGVGIVEGSALESTELIEMAGAQGLRLEATEAMGQMRDGPAATFCARCFLMLEERAVVIVDRVRLPHPGRVESRLHTLADVTLGEQRAFLRGEASALSVAFDATVPGLLASATTAPTTPAEPSATVVRWCTEDRAHDDVTLVTLLSPGASDAAVSVRREDGVIILEVSDASRQRTLSLSEDLRPLDEEV